MIYRPLLTLALAASLCAPTAPALAKDAPAKLADPS